MTKYAIVFFPESTTDAIQAFRLTFDPKAELIAPHITLVFPFPANETDLDELTLEIETKLAHHRAFQAQLKDVHLDPEDGLLQLLVQDGRQRMISLHNDLYSGILAPHWRQEIEYLPHLTLGAFKSNNGAMDQPKYTRALEQLKEAPLTFSFTFNNVHLIAIDGGRQPREIIRSFALI